MVEYSLSPLEIFVDHQKARRSGHMGHAMVEYAPDCLIAFYSNVDGERVDGHSGYGWMEYRRSVDGGMSWDTPEILAPSRKMYDKGAHTALCEKAICCDDGTIVLFLMITDASLPISCEPWSEPMLVTSKDGGKTFGEPHTFGAERGRVYDAVARNGRVLVLSQSNDASVSFLGNRPEHCYKLYESRDCAHTFHELSVLPFSAIGMGYGTLEFDERGALYAYIYDAEHEDELVCLISPDGGCTWKPPMRTHFLGKIRNPQVVRIGTCWFLHGRNGEKGDGLILYTSDDGLIWDKGRMIARRPKGSGIGYYSNNLAVSRFNRQSPQRIRIQFSHVYEMNRVNIAHIWIQDIHMRD